VVDGLPGTSARAFCRGSTKYPLPETAASRDKPSGASLWPTGHTHRSTLSARLSCRSVVYIDPAGHFTGKSRFLMSRPRGLGGLIKCLHRYRLRPGECLESRHRLFISSWHRTGGFAIGSRSGSVTVAVQGSGGELANAQTARQSVGGGEAKLVRRTEVSALAGKKVLGV
jgi:hypothetical protein